MFPGAFRAEDLTYSSRGRFRDPVPISAGGTATVFQAFDISLGHSVAVKVSHGTLEANHCLREEHRLLTGPLADIGEPGHEPTACRCFGLVEIEGRVAIVLEYLDPEHYQPADELAQRVSELTEHQVLEVLVPFFGLLAAAHEMGVIYNDAGRDKAGHLLWDQDTRQLKVIDWANAIDTTRASSTQTRRPYHDVVGCGELLLLMRRGLDDDGNAAPVDLQSLGEFGELVGRCLNFADSDSFATAHPLEKACRQRMRDIERDFAIQAAELQTLFASGTPPDDFEAAKVRMAALRELIPEHPALAELDQQLRGWTASLTARNLLEQAEAELLAGQPAPAAQKLRLVMNLARSHPDLALQRSEAAVQLSLAFSGALQDYPTFIPAGSLVEVLQSDAETLPAVTLGLLRELLGSEEMLQQREAEPTFALGFLGALAACANRTLWSARIHALEADEAWTGNPERVQALEELRQSLERLARSRPSDDNWGDLVGCYEGMLDEVRAIQAADPNALENLDEDVARALLLARRARDEWASGQFSSSIGMLGQLRETDIESRAATTWVGHARAVEARWGFPREQPRLPTAVTWLLTEESPAAVAFLLRDAVSELEGWAKSAPSIRDTHEEADEPSYLESLRLILEAFLRIFEYLGVPRQRHPAQKLALRALVACVEEFDGVPAIRLVGQGLRNSDRDDVAWQFANESVQISQAIEERRKDQPIFRKITSIGQQQRPQPVAPNAQLVEVMQRLSVAGNSLPLIGTLIRLPEVRYQAALAYCELNDLDAAKVVLGDLQIVGTQSDETIVRATTLHRAVALAQSATVDAREGHTAEATLKIDRALHELDANPNFRHEFRSIAQILKERKAVVARPDGPSTTATPQGSL